MGQHKRELCWQEGNRVRKKNKKNRNSWSELPTSKRQREERKREKGNAKREEGE